MNKSKKSQIVKLLLVAMCTSLMPTIIVSAEEYNTKVTGTNAVQRTVSAISITNKSDFQFDPATGTITGYTGSDSVLVIPNEIDGVKVTSIGELAFWCCRNLKNVAIPSSVTSIDNYAFWHCDGLGSITIPSSVTSIGRSVFWNCDSLKSIIIPGSVRSIGEYAFRDCQSLKSVIIQDGVTSIDDYVFRDCINLTSVTIPDSVTNIGEYAFWRSDNVTFYVNSERAKQVLINSGEDQDSIKLNGETSTIYVSSLALDYKSLEIEKGYTRTLIRTVSPGNATNKEVIWSSNNTNVATVDENGNVTGVGNGSVTITCTASDGSGTSVTCLVTVVNEVTVKMSRIKLSILNGGDQTFTLVPTILPSNTTIKDVTWSSSNTNVATVDINGNVTYVGKGSATITCAAKDGSGVSASMYVQNDYYTNETK